MSQWMDVNFADNVGPALLLLDKFSGHWTEEVKQAAERNNVILMLVPPGCTSVSQPADVAWNKPFKDYIRRSWADCMIERLSKGQPIECPTRDTVVRWILDSWEKVDCIEGGFRNAQLVPMADQEEPEDMLMEEFTQAAHSDFPSMASLGLALRGLEDQFGETEDDSELQ